MKPNGLIIDYVFSTFNSTLETDISLVPDQACNKQCQKIAPISGRQRERPKILEYSHQTLVDPEMNFTQATKSMVNPGDSTHQPSLAPTNSSRTVVYEGMLEGEASWNPNQKIYFFGVT